MSKEIVNIETETISSKIFEIRGQKVMLDRDLAALYEVETKRLNEQVRRNEDKFDDYIFQLSKNEKDELVAKCDRFKSLKHSSSTPYAFTEHGVLMISSVLNSKVAVQINRKIIDVFVHLRKQINTNSNYTELKEQLNRLERQVINVEDTFKLQQRIDTNSQNKKIIQLTEQVGAFTKIMNEFQDNNLIIKRPEDGGGIG
jgi:hypothetical protein